MRQLEPYLRAFEAELKNYREQLPEDGLHAPIRYILALGGKRIRPALVMLAAEAFGSDFSESLPAALAVEIFHNFSLVHDDIMDAAPLRRGQATVHHRWDSNRAILSGDAMLIAAYKQLERCGKDKLPALFSLFNKTAFEVCLGQQYDMDFENEMDVSTERYIEMISLKTAVLLGCSLKMGALVANASEEDAEKLYQYGKLAGIGFQIQDDFLDAFGDPDRFGKQVGGDILSGKKTLLSTYALQVAEGSEAAELKSIYNGEREMPAGEKVRRVQELFRSLGAGEHALQVADRYFEQAAGCLDALQLPESQKNGLRAFLDGLRVREY